MEKKKYPNRSSRENEAPREPKDFIYGARTVIEAIEAGKQIDKILLKKGIDSELRNDVTVLAEQNGIPMQTVPIEKLDRMARNLNHQGVIAFTSVITYADIEVVMLQLKEKGKEPCLLMLDQVNDVRNFGAIVRTAECLGVDAIVIPEQGSARINSDAMKVSAGALNHLPICRVHHLQDVVHMLKEQEIKLVSCTEKATMMAYEADLKGPVCFVFGSEEKGITPRIIRFSDMEVSIPMLGHIGSLNVGVSVGIILAESLRQRLTS